MAKSTFLHSLAPRLLVPLVMATACRTKPPPQVSGPQTIAQPAKYQPREPRTGTVLTYDSKGRRVVAGSFVGELKLGEKSITAIDGVDAFVAVWERNGRLAWLKHLPGPSHQTATGVTLDKEDNVIVAGTLQGDMTASEKPLPFKPDAGRHHGVYLVKLNATNGGVVWSRLVARLAMETLVSVAFDPDQRLAVGGTFIRYVELNGKGVTGESGQSMFIAYARPLDGTVVEHTTSLLSFWRGIDWNPCPHHPYDTGAGISPLCANPKTWGDCAARVCNVPDYGYCCGGSTDAPDGVVWDDRCVGQARILCPGL